MSPIFINLLWFDVRRIRDERVLVVKTIIITGQGIVALLNRIQLRGLLPDLIAFKELRGCLLKQDLGYNDYNY